MPLNIAGINVLSSNIAILKGASPLLDGLVLYTDAGIANSYPGSGTTWSDLSPNSFNSTLVNGPTYSKNNNGLIVLDGTNDYVSIPGNTTIYSSDFTWQSFHYYRNATGETLEGMWWSETGNGKNFLTGYRNVDLTNTYFRIDTSATVYQSVVVGTQYNGFGNTAGPVTGRWLFTTIVKSGTTFSLYWNNAVLMWQVTISNWNIGVPSQAIAFGAKNDASYPSPMNIANILMYNKALSTAEITQNYNILRARIGV